MLRLRGGKTTEVLKGRHVDRLVLSSDGKSLLAIGTARPHGDDEEPNDYGRTSVLDLDPATGGIPKNHGAPAGDEGTIMSIDRADKVDGVVGAQASVDCTDFGEGKPPRCVPLQTWQSDGTTWQKVAGTEGREVYWQSPTARISWTHLSEEEAMRKGVKDLDGPMEYDAGGKTTVVAPATAFKRAVPASLLKP